MKPKMNPAVSARSSFPAERAHVVIISRWQLSCARSDAWQLLCDLSTWPMWWPQISAVSSHKMSAITKSLKATIFTCRNVLAYEMVIEQSKAEQEPKHEPETLARYEIEYRLAGRIEGNGLWILEEADQGRTPHANGVVNSHQVYVTHRCEVVLNKTWMPYLAPLLHWVFSWNHKRMMRACALGMARQLQCEASAFTTWSINKN